MRRGHLRVYECGRTRGRLRIFTPHCGQWRSLRRISLASGAECSDQALAAVAALPRLHTLELGGTAGLTDRGCALLARLAGTRLRALALEHVRLVSDRGFAALGGLHGLTSLRLVDATRLHDRGLAPLLRGTTALQRLELLSLNWISLGIEAQLAPLVDQHALAHIDVSDSAPCSNWREQWSESVKAVTRDEHGNKDGPQQQ